MRISDWSSDVCSSDLDRKTIRCNIAAGRASCGFAKNRRPGGRSAQLRLGLQHVFTGDMEGLCTRLAGLARQPKPRHASAVSRNSWSWKPPDRRHDEAVSARTEEHTSELQSLMRIS